MTLMIKIPDLNDVIRHANKDTVTPHFSDEAWKALYEYYQTSGHDPIDLSTEIDIIYEEWKEISMDDFLVKHPDARPWLFSLRKNNGEIIGKMNLEGLKETYGVLSVQNGKVLYNTKESDLT